VGKKNSSRRMEHIDAQCRIRTLGKIPPWVKVSDRKGKKCCEVCI
jgi:hypothetical protein